MQRHPTKTFLCQVEKQNNFLTKQHFQILKWVENLAAINSWPMDLKHSQRFLEFTCSNLRFFGWGFKWPLTPEPNGIGSSSLIFFSTQWAPPPQKNKKCSISCSDLKKINLLIVVHYTKEHVVCLQVTISFRLRINHGGNLVGIRGHPPPTFYASKLWQWNKYSLRPNYWWAWWEPLPLSLPVHVTACGFWWRGLWSSR